MRLTNTFLMAVCLSFTACNLNAADTTPKAPLVDAEDLSDLISKERFLSYAHVGDFIDDSPQVSITVESSPEDIEKYGKGVMKTLTGSDCDRDGKMDDNQTCNAVYVKLWLKYAR